MNAELLRSVHVHFECKTNLFSEEKKKNIYKIEYTYKKARVTNIYVKRKKCEKYSAVSGWYKVFCPAKDRTTLLIIFSLTLIRMSLEKKLQILFKTIFKSGMGRKLYGHSF